MSGDNIVKGSFLPFVSYCLKSDYFYVHKIKGDPWFSIQDRITEEIGKTSQNGAID